MGFGGERIDETDFSLGGVVGVDVLFVQVDELGFGESSELSDLNGGADTGKGGKSCDNLHFNVCLKQL